MEVCDVMRRMSKQNSNNIQGNEQASIINSTYQNGLSLLIVKDFTKEMSHNIYHTIDTVVDDNPLFIASLINLCSAL